MTPCPSDEVLGALVQRSLGEDESEIVRSHLDECDSCAKIVIAAVRAGVVHADAAATQAVGTPSLPRLRRGEPATAGSKIGRYEVRSLLGAGGIGYVYEAYDRELDRSIALKVLRPELAVVRTLTDRLMRESRLMAKVVHPSVITVHDVGRTGNDVFIAMELIRGETLGAWASLEKRGWRQIVELFERAGAGLAAAHRVGIVHRDFKPENVLVEVNDGVPARVVVTDFGIARATSIGDDLDDGVSERSDPRVTKTGTTVGTPAYMAPEQLAAAQVDARADVFAFAVSLWEAVFGERPFPGDTTDEIRVAMMKPPRVRVNLVPRDLVRTLERGLAIDPRDRWQDLSVFVAELTRLRTRRRRVGIAAGIAGLVAAGVGTTLFLAKPSAATPCASATVTYDAGALRAAIADPHVRDVVVAKVESVARAWRDTQRTTCHRDRTPPQAPATATCLDARRVELVGYLADVVLDRGAYAIDYAGVLGDPARCTDPAPGLLSATLPVDATRRRQATALRYRVFAAQAARDRADFKSATADATQLVNDSKAAWPMVHAESLYLLGTIQAQAGNTKAAIPTLREAAAVAETAHHDYIAANSWIQLVLSSTFDEGNPARGLEYVRYAQAALDRIGGPPLVMALFEYAKGATLVELDRLVEAEASLRHAVEIAESQAHELLPLAIQGLGYLYEQQARYADAVLAYQRALAKLPATGAGATSAAIVFRERLAINLSLLGQATEAEAESRRAIEIADAALPLENLDRAVTHTSLAQVLQSEGKLEPALTEVRGAVQAIATIDGERGERYAEAVELEANILSDLGRHAEAATRFARACDILGFQTGERSSTQAECWLAETVALSGLGENAAALVLIEKTLPILTRAYGESHPQVANALVTRGSLHSELGHHDAALADLQRAVELFGKIALDPGHLAAAQWGLAKELWASDPARARPLLTQALQTFEKAGASWAQTRAEAAEWLATNGKPKRR